MSQEITDAMIQAQTIASASERYDKITERDLWLAWKECKLAALEVERESLSFHEEAYSLIRENGYAGEEALFAHIQLLRTRLGIIE